MVHIVSQKVSSSKRPLAPGISCRIAIRPLLSIALLLAVQGASHAADAPLRGLLVGGGPNPASNQVAIESNLRYITKLLPPGFQGTTLFADGDKNSATVIYQPEGARRSPEEELLDALLQDPTRRRRRGSGGAPTRPAPPVGFGVATPTQPPATPDSLPQAPVAQVPRSVGNFKVPTLTKLDGASQTQNIEAAFGQLGGDTAKGPVFLYFTGHGSKTADNLENNYYNLWGNGKFTVEDLSRQLTRLPKNDPVVLVMVQCFSGSFGNVLFEGGDPKAELIDRDVVGFFASTKDRVAAGCTPAVNEEYYYDFTSYFFSALTGRDRLNRKAAPDADFNRDGKVGLDEAFYWSVTNDNSIDVPVATSDVFLERFAPLEGEAWLSTPYKSLFNWASPAQRASLEGLSKALGLSGEDRIRQAQNLDIPARTREVGAQIQNLNQRFQTLRLEARKTYLEAFPDLVSSSPEARTQARTQALAQLSAETQAGKWKAYQEMAAERATLQARSNEVPVAEAKRLRFLRLAQKVVRDHNLRTSNNGPIKKRYFKLLGSEARTLLPYQG